MRYRKMSPSGDYVFGNGQEDFYRDVPDAVAQAAKTRILLWLGEWFLDIEEGTPFMQGILGKYGIEVANTTILDRVRGTQGFAGIQDYESGIDPETRLMSVQFTIDTIYGPTAVEVANYANY